MRYMSKHTTDEDATSAELSPFACSMHLVHQRLNHLREGLSGRDRDITYHASDTCTAFDDESLHCFRIRHWPLPAT
jgi:hypothetical protein